MNHRFMTLLRLSLGLVGLTASVILVAQFIGIVPDETRSTLAYRRQTVETLALQLASGARDFERVRGDRVLKSLLERNPEVRSAALKDAEGVVLAQAGDHAKYYAALPNGTSTPDAVRVPIEMGGTLWGSLEVAFAPMPRSNSLSPRSNPLFALLLFVALSGGLGYFLVLRKALRMLDPSAVVPERVRMAMDALIEGVVIMDNEQQIVLANSSFANRIGVPAAALLGRRLSDINWRAADAATPLSDFPWGEALKGRRTADGTVLSVRGSTGNVCRLMVRATPILDGAGKTTGALATFDDITLLEQRNDELQRTLQQLKDSQDRIEQHNAELQFLATRDALTGCLNRRALFTEFDTAIAVARRNGTTLACAMVDIDHFKSVNDRFGHAVGDRVIWQMSDVLRRGVRPGDLVARYGGEEFCLVLPQAELRQALTLIDRLRGVATRELHNSLELDAKLTFSAGVAVLSDDIVEATELVNRADMALYAAKRSGRNRVLGWSADLVQDPLADQTIRLRRAADAAAATGLHGTLNAYHSEIEMLRARLAELEGDTALTASGRHQAPFGNAGRAEPGLVSESGFRKRLTAALAGNHLGAQHLTAVLHIEIEDFLRVREALGSPIAEQLLDSAVQRIFATLRRDDTLALLQTPNGPSEPLLFRAGGAEIAVLLENVDRRESLEWISKRVLSSLLLPCDVQGRQLSAAAVIGLSASSDEITDAEHLMRQASAGRRAARQRIGAERYGFHDGNQSEHDKARFDLESDLRLAIGRGEFTLHYQPKLDLRTGEISGVEALLRWQHPERGSVSPAELIPVAEETGLILPIGEWVLQIAARQVRLWQTVGLSNLRVAINVSPVQLRDRTFVERVARILAAVDLDPRFLEVEITENACISDLESAVDSLGRLRKLGVHVSLDDFGKGHSSLSLLRALPVDSIKIDRTFIAELTAERQSTAMVSAMNMMAHELGLRCVAEGVESADQLDVVRRIGCDEVQGYFIARPMPVAPATAYLRQQAAKFGARELPDDVGQVA